MKKDNSIRINTVTVRYNGNSKEFERFIESMIKEFLDSYNATSDKMTYFIGMVEKSKKSA